MGHPLSSQPDHLTALSAGANGYGSRSVQCLKFDGVAQSRLYHGHGDLAVEVVPVPFEELVGLDVHADVEIAGGATSVAAFSLVRDAKPRARIHTGRHFHQDRSRDPLHSRSGAGLAGILDDPSLAPAARASGADAEETLRLHHLPTALAGGTGLLSGPSFPACTSTGLTPNAGRNLDGLLRTEDRRLKGEAHIVEKIGSRLRRVPAPRSPAAEPEEIFEQVAEGGEDIVEAAEAGKTATLEALMTELVVDAPLLWIAKHFVGLGRLLEPLFRLFISWIPVGVMPQRELAVGFLDLVLAGVSTDTEYLIVVPFTHRSSASVRTRSSASSW